MCLSKRMLLIKFMLSTFEHKYPKEKKIMCSKSKGGVIDRKNQRPRFAYLGNKPKPNDIFASKN